MRPGVRRSRMMAKTKKVADVLLCSLAGWLTGWLDGWCGLARDLYFSVLDPTHVEEREEGEVKRKAAGLVTNRKPSRYDDVNEEATSTLLVMVMMMMMVLCTFVCCLVVL